MFYGSAAILRSISSLQVFLVMNSLLQAALSVCFWSCLSLILAGTNAVFFIPLKILCLDANN